MGKPYELYLIRHGVAEERGEAWPDDTKRPLSQDGSRRLKREMRGLVRVAGLFEVVLTSPLVRTRQTAEIVASAFDPKPPIVAIDSLAPGGSYQSILADLEKQLRRQRIGLVGHEPGIGELAAKLAGIRRPLKFKKGAVCRIDLETIPPAGFGTLRWFLPPRAFRNMKG
jgi:phosphohistidine phosphatase